MQTVSITVTGRVQGVFFRKYTLEAALKFGVTGFVKNTSVGDVYLEVTGPEPAIKEMTKWCHSGSLWSRVDKVIVDQLPYKQFDSFEIRY